MVISSRKIYGGILFFVTCACVYVMVEKELIRSRKPMSLIWNSSEYGYESDDVKTTIKRKPLPEVAIVRRVWHKYPGQTWRGLQLPVLTSEPRGRLGNVMGEYATLMAIGRIFSVTVRLHPGMKQQLINTFPHLTMQLIPGAFDRREWKEVRGVTFLNYAKAEAAASGILGPHLFVLTDWPFEIQLFNTYRKDVIKELTFSPDLQQKVRNFWQKYSNDTSRIRIGIHIRRTDYVNFIKQFHSELVGEPYFNRTTEYYRKKYPGCIFAVASDDMAHVIKVFANYSDVIFAPGSQREEDMAIMASCNHSIITVGSFGFWCGYLTGGEVAYPNITARNDYTFQKAWYDFGQLDFFTPFKPF